MFNFDIEKTPEFNQFKQFLRMPITSNFVDILAQKAILSVKSPTSRQQFQSVFDSTDSGCSPPYTPFEKLSISGDHQIHNFIVNLINGSRIQAATLFGAMVYLERLKNAIPFISFTRPDAPQAAVLASIILAGKFLNDASPKNKHWATYAKIFPLGEINAFEQQFFYYLNYDLKLSTAELIIQFRSFAHLVTNQTHLNTLTPVPSNYPSTPKSAVFPPMCKTPTNGRFPSRGSSPVSSEIRTLRNKGSNHRLSPIILPSNTSAKGPYPISVQAQLSSNVTFDSTTNKIRELSSSNSMLLRRRTNNKREPRKKTSLLSLNVSSEDRNQTLTQHSVTHPQPMNISPIVKSNVQAPLSAPLSAPVNKDAVRPNFTLRSNVPSDGSNFLTTPTTAVPLVVNNSLPNFDLSLKLPPIQGVKNEDLKDALPPIQYKMNYSQAL